MTGVSLCMTSRARIAWLGRKKKGGGALKCDALSGSGSSVPRSHLGAFDDARRVRVGEVSGAKNTSRG